MNADDVHSVYSSSSSGDSAKSSGSICSISNSSSGVEKCRGCGSGDLSLSDPSIEDSLEQLDETSSWAIANGKCAISRSSHLHEKRCSAEYSTQMISGTVEDGDNIGLRIGKDLDPCLTVLETKFANGKNQVVIGTVTNNCSRAAINGDAVDSSYTAPAIINPSYLPLHATAVANDRLGDEDANTPIAGVVYPVHSKYSGQSSHLYSAPNHASSRVAGSKIISNDGSNFFASNNPRKSHDDIDDIIHAKFTISDGTSSTGSNDFNSRNCSVSSSEPGAGEMEDNLPTESDALLCVKMMDENCCPTVATAQPVVANVLCPPAVTLNCESGSTGQLLMLPSDSARNGPDILDNSASLAESTANKIPVGGSFGMFNKLTSRVPAACRLLKSPKVKSPKSKKMVFPPDAQGSPTSPGIEMSLTGSSAMNNLNNSTTNAHRNGNSAELPVSTNGLDLSTNGGRSIPSNPACSTQLIPASLPTISPMITPTTLAIAKTNNNLYSFSQEKLPTSPLALSSRRSREKTGGIIKNKHLEIICNTGLSSPLENLMPDSPYVAGGRCAIDLEADAGPSTSAVGAATSEPATTPSHIRLKRAKQFLRLLQTSDDQGTRLPISPRGGSAAGKKFPGVTENSPTSARTLSTGGGGCPILGSLGGGLSLKSASYPSLGAHTGLKYNLVKDGQMSICRLNHPRNVLGKLATSKFLRRWESHHLVLDEEEIYSKTPIGFMEHPTRYSAIEDIHVMPNNDSSDRFCIRIFVPDGSILIQTNHAYVRNQWLYSLHWKKSMFRYRKIFEVVERADVLMKEVKNLVDQTRNTTLQDESIQTKPLELIADILSQILNGRLSASLIDQLITSSVPLLEDICPTDNLCLAFSRYCRENPRSPIVEEVFTKVAHQILKRNMDFVKFPSMRGFVQDFIIALVSQNDGLSKVRQFVRSAHGPACICPHPRVLANLLSVCLAAIRNLFDEQKNKDLVTPCSDAERCIDCFTSMLDVISEFDGWRMQLSNIIQPIPFPERALDHPTFSRNMASVLRRIASDERCEVHQCVLGVRDGREGWFNHFCPGGKSCFDEGELFALMLKTVLECCCKRKKFLISLNAMLGPLQLMALRETQAAMLAICYMLEYNLIEGGEDVRIMMSTALQSTCSGRKHYAQLCDREVALKELQQKGGPRKLTLPFKSTDQDLAVLLSSGAFGNLEWLSLAFTNVTGAAAEYLIKLPALKYLNLWSTQFSDNGVQLISEHLHKLQVLNLCETPVTDKGLTALISLKSLRKLNLNSTQLSPETFKTLRDKLPALQEVDVRYTEAWCAGMMHP